MKNKIKLWLKRSISFSALGSYLLVPAAAAAAAVSITPVSSITLEKLLTNIQDIIFVVVGFVVIIMFAIAGILYMTAAGNETRVASAKGTLNYAIIGVVVILAAFLIISVIKGLFGAK